MQAFAPSAGLRVLLIGDDAGRIATIRRAAASSAGRVDLEVQTRIDDASDSLATFDAVVLDERLRPTSGDRILQQLASLDRAVPVLLLMQADDLAAASGAIADGYTEVLMPSPSGELFERSLRLSIQRARLVRRATRLAFEDELTGLANRSLLADRLDSALERGRRHGRILAVMVIDLNGFKAVNDRLGHAAGDALLRLIGDALRTKVRASDTLARTGGDEFVLIAEELRDPADAQTIADKIVAAVAGVHAVNAQPVHVTASIGVALFPRDGDDRERLMRLADAAMYRAKRGGGAHVAFHDATLDPPALAGGTLAAGASIKDALADGRIALRGWPELPLQGGLPALRFEPVLPRTHSQHVRGRALAARAAADGAGHALMLWLVDQVARFYRSWPGDAPPPFRLALPIQSPNRHHALADMASLGTALRAQALPIAGLRIDIAEDLLEPDDAANESLTAELRRAGASIALDGYGGAGARLHQPSLRQLSAIRFDGGFIANASGRSRLLLTHLLELGQQYGLELIAAGVSKADQLRYLRRRGCSAVVAPFADPSGLPPATCRDWLDQERRRKGAA